MIKGVPGKTGEGRHGHDVGGHLVRAAAHDGEGGVTSSHTGRANGTNSNLIFTKQKILMFDFLMSALRRLWDAVVIFTIDGV